MAKKTANEKLLYAGDLPKVADQSDRPGFVERYGGTLLYIAAPMQYHEIMAAIPEGQLTTVDRVRAYLAKHADADLTCPLTAGIFTNVAAHASEERESGAQDSAAAQVGAPIAWWRTLKTDGELNPKYPGAFDEQVARLKSEGHEVVQKGKRWFVVNYEGALVDLDALLTRY